jgi:hypothetical protein
MYCDTNNINLLEKNKGSLMSDRAKIVFNRVLLILLNPCCINKISYAFALLPLSPMLHANAIVEDLNI